MNIKKMNISTISFLTKYYPFNEQYFSFLWIDIIIKFKPKK